MHGSIGKGFQDAWILILTNMFGFDLKSNIGGKYIYIYISNLKVIRTIPSQKRLHTLIIGIVVKGDRKISRILIIR